MGEIEDNIKPFWFKDISESNIQKYFSFLNKYYFNNENLTNIKTDFLNFQKKNDFNPILKFDYLITIYKIGRIRGIYPESKPKLEEKLKIQNVRENSGVIVFNIFTSTFPFWTKTYPNETKEIFHSYDKTLSVDRSEFTCKYDYSFCAKDSDVPKSYIATEPGVARAVHNDFDPVKQIFDQGLKILQQGHTVDKIEVLIFGCSFSYPTEYLIEFVRDIYWAFNVFMDWVFYNEFDAKFLDYFVEFRGKRLRGKKSLEEEIEINEISPCRVIGLTPETRPNLINYYIIKFFRKIGATRIQLSVQHINDDILRFNNRGFYNKDTIRAIKILKDNGFKISINIMLDMPKPEYMTKTEMIEIDKSMLETINNCSDYKVDYIKIYLCVVTQHTTIKSWYDQGLYKPYTDTKKIKQQKLKNMSSLQKRNFRFTNPLYQTIYDFMKNIHPSTRIKIIRDIPTNEIYGGIIDSGMRLEIYQDIKIVDDRSTDIRSHDVFNYQYKEQHPNKTINFKEIVFDSSEGKEYFLSWETNDANPVLFSFLRLRLSNNSGKTTTGKIIFPDLVNCALIREVKPFKQNQSYFKNYNILFEDNNNKVLHTGLATKLLEKAEEIALSNGFKKIAVIAGDGVGVREYYRNNGYTIDSHEGCYQIKLLERKKVVLSNTRIRIEIGLIILSIVLYFLNNYF